MEVHRKAEISRHDKYAPWWAAVLVAFTATGLSTLWMDWGGFWKGYVLDMVGPAWNYILFRGLFTAKTTNSWTRFFTPFKTYFLFLVVCFGIETAQYFQLYPATYDPMDFLAYISLLTPIFIIDFLIHKRDAAATKNRGATSNIHLNG